jgi:hypothetical protein
MASVSSQSFVLVGNPAVEICLGTGNVVVVVRRKSRVRIGMAIPL